ncbi:MAG: universal stress protein [Bacteroidota bacterium]
MNQILVPLNLRSDYLNLIQYATSISAKSYAHITLLYVGGRALLKGSGNFVYDGEQAPEDLYQKIRSPKIRQAIEAICTEFHRKEISFRFKFVSGFSLNEVIRETHRESYDMVLLGTHRNTGLRGYVQGAFAAKVIGEVETPVFVVPAKSRYNEIQHITYAVDLTDYDPNVIRQVKTIASMFDAKLSITHVNRSEEMEREQYLLSLERTIADTLDYPKVYYKFFDDSDPFRGIVKFVNLNNSNLVAMISRKKFSWRNFFSRKSMTRRMPEEVAVPVLAFNKHTV